MVSSLKMSLLLDGYNTPDSDLYLLEHLAFLNKRANNNPIDSERAMIEVIRDYIDFNKHQDKEHFFNDLPLKQLYSVMQTVKDEKDK